MFEIKNFLNKTKEILILSEKSRFKNLQKKKENVESFNFEFEIEGIIS